MGSLSPEGTKGAMETWPLSPLRSWDSSWLSCAQFLALGRLNTSDCWGRLSHFRCVLAARASKEPSVISLWMPSAGQGQRAGHSRTQEPSPQTEPLGKATYMSYVHCSHGLHLPWCTMKWGPEEPWEPTYGAWSAYVRHPQHPSCLCSLGTRQF